MIILLTLLVGSQDYNGAGMHVIEVCVMEGKVALGSVSFKDVVYGNYFGKRF